MKRFLNESIITYQAKILTTTMNLFFRLFALTFTILFVWAAILQNNDPDALMWYSIYGLAAVGSAAFAFGRLPFLAAAFLCLAYLVGSFLSWPETFEGFEINTGDIVNVEQGREACGLLIVSAVFLLFGLRMRYGKKRHFTDFSQ